MDQITAQRTNAMNQVSQTTLELEGMTTYITSFCAEFKTNAEYVKTFFLGDAHQKGRFSQLSEIIKQELKTAQQRVNDCDIYIKQTIRDDMKLHHFDTRIQEQVTYQLSSLQTNVDNEIANFKTIATSTRERIARILTIVAKMKLDPQPTALPECEFEVCDLKSAFTSANFSQIPETHYEFPYQVFYSKKSEFNITDMTDDLKQEYRTCLEKLSLQSSKIVQAVNSVKYHGIKFENDEGVDIDIPNAKYDELIKEIYKFENDVAIIARLSVALVACVKDNFENYMESTEGSTTINIPEISNKIMTRMTEMSQVAVSDQMKEFKQFLVRLNKLKELKLFKGHILKFLPHQQTAERKLRNYIHLSLYETSVSGTQATTVVAKKYVAELFNTIVARGTFDSRSLLTSLNDPSFRDPYLTADAIENINRNGGYLTLSRNYNIFSDSALQGAPNKAEHKLFDYQVVLPLALLTSEAKRSDDISAAVPWLILEWAKHPCYLMSSAD